MNPHLIFVESVINASMLTDQQSYDKTYMWQKPSARLKGLTQLILHKAATFVPRTSIEHES